MQTLIWENPTLDKIPTDEEIPELLEQLSEELAELMARRSVEDKIEKKIAEKMEERHQEYVKDIKMQVLKDEKVEEEETPQEIGRAVQ